MRTQAVGVLNPQGFEHFQCEQPYTVVIANNLFEYMDADPIRQSAQRINDICADLFIYVPDDCDREKRILLEQCRSQSFQRILRHHGWKKSALAEYLTTCESYNAWVRCSP
jgi:hypothetical protein